MFPRIELFLGCHWRCRCPKSLPNSPKVTFLDSSQFSRKALWSAPNTLHNSIYDVPKRWRAGQPQRWSLLFGSFFVISWVRFKSHLERNLGRLQRQWKRLRPSQHSKLTVQQTPRPRGRETRGKSHQNQILRIFRCRTFHRLDSHPWNLVQRHAPLGALYVG